jgi:hypothetical protein
MKNPLKFLLVGLAAISISALSALAQDCFTAAVTPLNTFAIPRQTVTFTANITGGVGPFSMYWVTEKGRLLTSFTGDNRAVALSNVTQADAGLVYLVCYDLGTGCGSVTAGKLFVSSP